MFKSLKVFADRKSNTIAIVGPKHRGGKFLEVIPWLGFDGSHVDGFDNRLEYARLFADAPRLKAELEAAYAAIRDFHKWHTNQRPYWVVGDVEFDPALDYADGPLYKDHQNVILAAQSSGKG